MIEYNTQKKEIDQIEFLTRQKEKVVSRAEGQKKRIEERKQALLDRPNPFQKEIEICEDLIANCHRLRVMAGLAEAREATLEDLEKKLINEMAIQDLDKRVEEGKLERFKTKEER